MATRVSAQQNAIILNDFGSLTQALAWSGDGNLLFIGTKEKGLTGYDLISGHLLDFVGNNANIQSLALSPDDKTLAAGLAEDGSIRLLSAQTVALKLTIWPAHDGPVQALAFNPDGKTLASGGDDGKVLLWDVATGKLVRTLYDKGGWVWGLAFTPDGKGLIAGFQLEYKFRFWNTRSWQLQNTFDGDQAADLAVSPDGQKFVTAGGGIHESNLWSVKGGQHLFTLGDAPGWVWAVAYSPDGKYVASGGIGEVIILWDVDTGKPFRELYNGGDFIQALAFSPDGTKLASAGQRVLIWDLSHLASESSSP